MKQLKKTLLTLVALLAVTTGAWADETPLLTIESKNNTSFTSGSKTFDDKVTVTFSNEVYNNGDASGWYGGGTASLLTVAGINGYTITSCKFYTNIGIAKTGYTVEGESPSVYLSGGYVYTDASKSVRIGNIGITKIEVYGGVAPAASGPEVAWDKAANTGTFKMPGGNVTLEPEYYPQAALTAAPTAINDVPATTDGAIVKAGTVANIGSTETAQGTVMYYVSPTALDDAALLALAADQWKADVPTAEKLAQGKAYVYYYVRGNDSDTDEENFSDGDILAANALQVTLGAAPLWNAEFDLTDAPEADKTGKWSTNIPEGGVTKGQTVTVTYTGTKKVLGVKAEKKSATPSLNITSPVVGQVIGSDGKNYAANATLPDGVTAVAMIAYVGSETDNTTYTHGLAIALADEGSMNWSTAKSTCEGMTPAVTGAAWLLPSPNQWKAMFKANGGNEGKYTGLNTAITTAGGTALQESGKYWSSTEYGEGFANGVGLYYGNAYWGAGSMVNSYLVRACLAF
jgi:hypothetical protein